MSARDPAKFGEREDTLFVDVDGCLLIWRGDKPGRTPRPGEPHEHEPPDVNRDLVARINETGLPVVVWSRGGSKHARYAADICGLKKVVACISKPRVMVDDSFTWIEKSKAVQRRDERWQVVGG